MKKIVFLLLAVFMLAGCRQVDPSYKGKVPTGCQIIIIDGCEYVEYVDCGYGIAHKGNCKYCKIRREIEQDSLIAKLKNQ